MLSEIRKIKIKITLSVIMFFICSFSIFISWEEVIALKFGYIYLILMLVMLAFLYAKCWSIASSFKCPSCSKPIIMESRGAVQNSFPKKCVFCGVSFEK